MKNRSASIGRIVGLVVLFVSAFGSWAEDLSFEDGRILIKTEATLKDGLSSIDIRCPVKSARVYIDSVYKGLCPYKADITPGAHYIQVQATGYYPLHLGLVFNEKTLYTMTFTPIQIVGWLYTSIQPANASLILDGEPIDTGFTKLPVGSYSLTARRFGYQEQTVDIKIEENRTTRVDIQLRPAAFSVSDFRAHRSRFNPANGGAGGRSTLAFTVTNYGSARIEITGPDGSIVETFDLPRLTTWSQGVSWNGRDKEGKILPDGLYTAHLSAVPGTDVPRLPPGPVTGGEVAEDGSITLTTDVVIDSSISIDAVGALSAVPGLSSFPSPRPQIAGTTAIELSWLTPAWQTSASALGLSMSISLGGTSSLSLAGAGEFAGTGSLDLAASFLVSLLDDEYRNARSGVGGALFVRGSWTNAAQASMPESRTAVELSSPWSLSFEGFTIGASAGALLDFTSSELRLYGLARTGFWDDGRWFRIGLSGYVPIEFGFDGGTTGPVWPARIAAELRCMLGSSPFTLSAYSMADIEPGSPISYSAGIGLGLLF
jgi:hypothetical protein